MKWLITGADGALGRAATDVLPALGHEVVATVRRPRDAGPLAAALSLDVTRPDEVARTLDRTVPDAVLHAAAWTDVDACERDPGRASALNAGSAATLARLCRERGRTLVYPSSGAVFDGLSREGYAEGERPAPVNHYGRSKLAGERAVREAGGAHLIVRAGWLVGGPESRKFLSVVLGRLLRGEREIPAAVDRTGSLTFADDLVRAIAWLVSRERQGIHHVVHPGACSHLEVVQAAVEVLGLADARVHGVPSTHFGHVAPRPRHEVLRSGLAPGAAHPVLRAWPEALADWLRSHWRERVP